MKKPLLTICLLMSCMTAFAQAKVESRISAMMMLIGEQVTVDVMVTAPESARVEFPQTAQIPEGIEFLGAVDNPQEEAADGQICYSRSYVFTSFEDTLYYLPPMTVKVDGKEYTTNKLALKVLDVEVDTLHLDQFRPPKLVQDNPFLWSDWSTPFWLSVLLLLMLVVVYYLYTRLRSNKPVIVSFKMVKRLLPHQKAMKAIEGIKADHIITSEDPKVYYTRLTDALRHYIEERYGFSAMEMTSSEIISQLTQNSDQTMLNELRQLFETADLVKFAKYSTLINENDANLVNAIDFINKTKIDTPPSDEQEKPQLTADQQRTLKSRKKLRGFIIGLTLACVALFVYILYALYLILL